MAQVAKHHAQQLRPVAEAFPVLGLSKLAALGVTQYMG
jgi:hypothetical protein